MLILIVLLLSSIHIVKAYEEEENTCSISSKKEIKESADTLETAGFIDPSLNELDQEDPKLIEIIRSQLIALPANKSSLYNLKHITGGNKYHHSAIIKERLIGQYGQADTADNNIFKRRKKKGFFIEAGAYDGEVFSNSLYFELLHQWNGLLVEPNPDFYKLLLGKNRKVHSLPHCFSTKKKPEIVEFDASALIGGIINPGRIKPGDIGRSPDYTNRPYNRRTIRIQCFPFYSILMAMGNPTVDYFSLDVEGAEYEILKTIPFDKVDIKVLDVEIAHAGKVFDGSIDEIVDYLKKNGYKLKEQVKIDYLFVKKGTKY